MRSPDGKNSTFSAQPYAHMKIGIIDLGSNTFNLLIAEIDDRGGYKPLYRSKVGVKLGEGGFERNYITEAAMERAFVALQAQLAAIQNQYCDRVLAFATSAIRSASNGAQFVEKVKETLGITIHIISGDREAEMIYHGVQLSGSLSQEAQLVMDIGGGSTEFIICNEDEIFWKRSYELGVSRLLEKFNPEDPISPETIARLESFLDVQLVDMYKASAEWKVKGLIGSSGSFDTFSDLLSMRKGDYEIQLEQPSWPLEKAALRSELDTLIRSTRHQREMMPGMLPLRVNMIVLSALFVRLMFKHLPFESARLSRYSLKEGVLFDVLKGNL